MMQVAGILQQDDKYEQDQDLWQEDDDAANTRDYAVGNQARKSTVTELRRDGGSKYRSRPVDQVHDRCRPGKDRLEYNRHDQEQAYCSWNGSIQKCAETRAPGIEWRHFLLYFFEHIANPAITHARFTGQRWIGLEQLFTVLLYLSGRILTETVEHVLIGASCAVDEQPRNLGNTYWHGCRLSKFGCCRR
jgi:hypothetical protein